MEPAVAGGKLPFALRRLLWKVAGEKESEAERLPRLGDTVGGYHLEALLGRGGYGTVYRGRCGGRLCAVKLLSLRHARTWGKRELEVLLRLRPGGVATLEGHGYWPPQAPRFLFLATEYVKGRTLEAWAREGNPCAREVAGKVRGVARVLRAVHAAGVVHGDLKGTNVLVREDGEVVLVDFGAASYPGAPRLTALLPPCTPHYRSPEALRFLLRRRKRGVRYEATPLDDLWALGVLLYWLLTGTRPFDVTEPDAVLHQRPEPPHERNPRVPEALSAVCLRLLEKAPEARYPDALAVEEALASVLEGARGEAAWEVPLCDAYGPEHATTLVVAPLEGEEALARQARLEAWDEQRPPVRGRPASPERRGPPTRSLRAVAWGVLALAVVGLVLVGREMARGEASFEADRSAAAPPGASSPAPMETMHMEDSKRQGVGSSLKKACVGAACCAALSGGCTGAQVRPAPPPPEACPEGAVQVMRELGIRLGETHTASFDVGAAPSSNIPVREGEASLIVVVRWQGLPDTSILRGRLFFGEERVYGRFTEARTPRGQVYPVCMEAWDSEGGRGMLREGGERGRETAQVFSSLDVKAVDRFE